MSFCVEPKGGVAESIVGNLSDAIFKDLS